MNATLLRLLVAAAARGAERGTLIEIVDTAAKLLALIRPLLADAEERPVEAQSAEPGPR